MKTIRAIILLIAAISTACIANADLPSEFVTKNPDGSIKTKGKYTRNSEGIVIRFDVFDGQGKPLYSEIPYHSGDGRIIRGDRIKPDGTLSQVVVYLKDKAVVLDPSGKILEIQGFSQEEYLKAQSPKNQ